MTMEGDETIDSAAAALAAAPVEVVAELGESRYWATRCWASRPCRAWPAGIGRRRFLRRGANSAKGEFVNVDGESASGSPVRCGEGQPRSRRRLSTISANVVAVADHRAADAHEGAVRRWRPNVACGSAG